MSTMPSINQITTAKHPHYKLDKISLCYSEHDSEQSMITANMLIGDHINKQIAGYSVVSNPRYKASARIRLPLNSVGNQNMVVFEAGPQKPGTSAYRLEFNPDKIGSDGLNDLLSLIGTWVDVDPLVFFLTSKVTRCDVALDLPGLSLAEVIVKGAGLRKHGVYSDQHGNPQTIYIGTAKSRRVVAYDKQIDDGPETLLRLECRIKPQCPGHAMAQIKNPFKKVQLIETGFLTGQGFGFAEPFIADTMRIGGLKRALRYLDQKQSKALKNAFENSHSILPEPATLWAHWPETLISYGLGKELGAVPVSTFTPKGEIPLSVSTQKAA